MSQLLSLQARFHSLLARIEAHAKIFFRWIKCWHTRQDKIQEVLGLAWKWVRQLHQAGKRWWSFVSRLADYACRAVKSGRKVAGSITIKDVMNEITQRRQSFYVGKLPDFATESVNPLSEALTDNTVSDVPDQVAFRIDFPAWVSQQSDRDRALLTDMAIGHRTQDLARCYRMSEGRISQLRRSFHDDWRRYTNAQPASVVR